MKHVLITIEGTDGCGKKTQVKRLYDYLKAKKHEVITVSFPNYDSASSGPVKMYLGGEFGETGDCMTAYQASALYAVDRMATMTKLMKSLEKPTIILFDRYVQSNMIHQAGKIKCEQELEDFLDWLDKFEFETLKLPRVDKTIFLDVPVEVSYRIASEREQMKIGEAFSYDIHERDKKHLLESYIAGKFVAQKYDWEVINCADGDRLKSISDIHEMIKKVVKPILKK